MFNTMQTTFPIRPTSELPLLLRSLETSDMVDTELYRVIQSFASAFSSKFVVHPEIQQEDVDAFAPLMQWIEQPIQLEVSVEHLWRLHGALDHHYRHYRPDCLVTERLWCTLTDAVGSLDRPAG